MDAQTRSAYITARQAIISGNRSRRMRGLKPRPVPMPLTPQYRVQLTTANGDYIGTWPSGVSTVEAVREARELGYTVTRVEMVRA